MIEARSNEPRSAEIIENLQTELKVFITESVKDEKPKEYIFRACAAKVRKAREALPDDELKAQLDESAPRYIKTLYEQISRMLEAARAMVRVYAQDREEKGKPVKVEKTGLLKEGVPDVELYNMEPAARDYFAAYHRDVKRELNGILSAAIKTEYDGNVNLRTIAELRVRYDEQKRMINSLEEEGEDLVWIDSHANTSKRCQPWQGKLYRLSGRSGTVDGIPFRPLTDATDIPYTTKRGRTYMNGCITGFGCRHKLTPYRKGSKPQKISAETIKKKREAEERQRAMEREIRYQKEKAAVLAAIDPKEATKARAKARALTKSYDAFSKRAGMPIVRERTRVVFGENIYERNKARKEKPTKTPQGAKIGGTDPYRAADRRKRGGENSPQGEYRTPHR